MKNARSPRSVFYFRSFVFDAMPLCWCILLNTGAGYTCCWLSPEEEVFSEERFSFFHKAVRIIELVGLVVLITILKVAPMLEDVLQRSMRIGYISFGAF